MKYSKFDARPMHTDKIYHTDCWSFRIPPNGKPGCHALIKIDCVNCKFYKTKKQVEEEKQKTEERLERLGLSNIPKEYEKRSFKYGRKT